jgi:hypothetical protein
MASYTGDWVLDESRSCGDEVFTPLYTVGYGKATHLGKMKIETWDCVNFATGVIADGVVKFTAANGDELHGTFFGEASPNGEFTIWSEYTGGTGRFEHATGEATEVGLVVPTSSEPAGTIEGTLIGWVAYDASDLSSSMLGT